MRSEEWSVLHSFLFLIHTAADPVTQQEKKDIIICEILANSERRRLSALIFMKKSSVLFVLWAFALFALIIPAAAQTELPAIDAVEAADLLGRWYMSSACDAEQSCMNMGDYGIVLSYELNADNTITVSSAEGDVSTLYWYMENGTAYSIVPITETRNEINELFINENGDLVSQTTGSYVIFTREEPAAAFSEVIAADAGTADYEGEWHIKGTLIQGKMLPAGMIGTDVVLLIDGESFLLSDETGEQAAAYIIDAGKLYAVIEGTDDQGQTVEEYVMMELHDDGSLFFYFDPGAENEFGMVFTREKNVYSGTDLVDAVGMDTNGESSFSGLLDGLTSEEGGLDFSGLVQQMTGGEGLDINGLIQQVTGDEGFDINGLIQQVTGSENFDLSSLMSGLTGSEEAGGFDLSGLLDGLSSESAEGEGGFNISGLLDMLGSGN